MFHLRPGSTELEQKILAERVKAAYDQAVMTAINSWATALLFLLIPNNHVSRTVFWGWFAAITLSCLARITTAYVFKQTDITLANYPKWGVAYAAAVMSTAVVWSSALFILTANGPAEYQLFLMMVLVALCIGASHASTTYPLVGLAYNLPVMSSFIISCLLTGGIGFYVMAALGSVFAVMMVVVGRDSDKRFEEVQQLRFELSEKKEDAENANIAKSRFLAAASHDLRQPLHALTLFTGLLKEKASYPDVLKIVDNIDSSVDALQSLFSSLLDISKLDAGTVNVEKGVFPLKQILGPIENEFKIEAQSKGLEFLVEHTDERVESDANLLSRIIRNLVANAIRYTDEGSVMITSRKEDGHLLIEVRDTGLGIAQEHQSEIFDEFVQLGNPERDSKKGLGLGLAIVRRLTNLMGHDLHIKSAPTAGTSFFITVPAGKIAAQMAPENISAAANLLSTLSLDGLRVVLVDDDLKIREGTIGLLSSWGCEALGFACAEEAITHFETVGIAPDVVLADYRLVDNETGIDAIKKIREAVGCVVPAAIVTGDTAANRLQEAEKSGFTLLHKPVKPVQLRRLLTRLKPQSQAG